jgi:hypothetical protein
MPDSVHQRSLGTRVIQGLGLALLLVVFRMAAGLFGSSIRWGEVIMVGAAASLGGTLGGLAFYATDGLRIAGGWRHTMANVLSLLAYCAGAGAAILLLSTSGTQ